MNRMSILTDLFCDYNVFSTIESIVLWRQGIILHYQDTSCPKRKIYILMHEMMMVKVVIADDDATDDVDDVWAILHFAGFRPDLQLREV